MTGTYIYVALTIQTGNGRLFAATKAEPARMANRFTLNSRRGSNSSLAT